MQKFITQDYAWMLMTVVGMSAQVLTDGFIIYPLRKRLFNKEFFERHFPEIKPPPVEGYPDMGNGPYAQKLNHDEWRLFNNYQRAHYNGLEQLGSQVFMMLISGLKYPRLTAGIGVMYIYGRYLYGREYRREGPTGRFKGVLFTDLALLLEIGLATYATWSLGGGSTGLLKFIGWSD